VGRARNGVSHPRTCSGSCLRRRRNSIWLAQRGWQVTGIDFSAEAIRKARTLAEVAEGPIVPVDWRCADATTIQLPAEFDLVLIVYLQLPKQQRRAALGTAWRSLAPGGTLIVIAHDSDNLEHGVGGPKDPAVLYTAADIATDLAALDASAQVELAEQVSRPVVATDRAALDALFRARKSRERRHEHRRRRPSARALDARCPRASRRRCRLAR
jgi:SAM-dependent methyltransferase